MMAASHKTAVYALLGAVFALSAASCGENKTKSGQLNNGDSQSADPETDALAEAAFGQSQDPSTWRGGSTSRISSGKATGQGSTSSTSVWSLVLGTFSGEGHEMSAATMAANLRNIAPQTAPELANARVHSNSRSSLVLYGYYRDREDPRARADQERFKAVQFQSRPLFNRVILTHIDTRTAEDALHPNDLLSARKTHPNVVPMYTVDVAVWDDLGSGKLKWDDIRSSSEAHCQKLRLQGLEAYFYHDEQNKRSSVTVGLFDQRAINPKSGMFSDDVMAVMKQFPARLVNGEPLMELTEPYKWYPTDKSQRTPKDTRPQPPKLVLVPEM